MKVRKATKADIREILSMMKSLFSTWHKIDPMDKIDNKWFSSKEAAKFIEKRIKKSSYLIAEEDSKIIGYIYGFIQIRDPCLVDKKVGLIDEIYIKPKYRKKGVSKALVGEVLNRFKSEKIKWSIVLTHSKDKPANSYWKSVGYEDYNMKYHMRLR